MNREGKLYALLATARIANVPSVVSNLGAGVLLGSLAAGDEFAWPWPLMIAAILFYVSGNFLNDWADREWDIKHRPERALPRRLFLPHEYLNFACAGIAVGMILAAIHGWGAVIVSVLLVGFIALYTKVHKTAAWSVIPMGFCRACLPVLGYVGVREGFSGVALVPAVALLLYIIALSLSARFEAKGDMPIAKRNQATAMLVGAGVLPLLLSLFVDPLLGWIGIFPFGIWLALSLGKYRSPVPVHVSALLAGIPLLDAVILLPMSLIWLRLQRVEANDGMFLTALLLPLAAFVLGRALQRLAPAT